ncbi:MAG: TatD family deoxyribonuclease [Ruminococcaceae bacterium]|nr:TatD family deoxyribonuclease [Oscillospiraceae bacterium]
MILFDSHAHYNDRAFGDETERNARIAEILSGDVGYLINVGTEPRNCRESLAIAETFDTVFAAVGLHPSDLYELDDPDVAFEEIRTMAAHPKTVAIGEIGLDYHWHEERKDFQKEWFHRQLTLAEELSLPVIIHDRDAHGDCLDVVLQHPNARGVFHSFSGSAETAAELVRRGWYISFSGVITFKNASRLAAIVPTIPDDRILIETDCPYLTPHPYRGQRNDSSYLRLTLEKAAELRGVSPEALAKQTLTNTARLFPKTGLTVTP